MPWIKPEPLDGESTTEFDLMMEGKPYLAGDPYKCRIGEVGAARLRAINAELDEGKRTALLRNFFTCEPDSQFGIVSPFFCEYGFNVHMGTDIWVGPGATFLDVNRITIGSHTLIGPNVQFYTPTHPILPEERNGCSGREAAKPITIGEHVWIGGAAIILPGVTIGEGSTVAAGAVVTKDVEPRTVVAGNPAKVIKRLPPPGAAGAV